MMIQIVKEKISRDTLREIAKNQFGNFVKAVVDIENEIMAVGADLHADEEALLLGQGHRQAFLWGINLYPEKSGDDFVEFDSMINIRPSQKNTSRSVEDARVREKIMKVVQKLIPD